MIGLIEQMNQAKQRLLAARTEGYNASTYADCPYISGQKVLGEWQDGFVAKCIETGVMPADTPLYVQGRLAYLQGLPCSAMPHGEQATGRWFSGWLVQQELTPIQPNKLEGGWLPIESAPRDGTRVELLGENGKLDVGAWYEFDEHLNKAECGIAPDVTGEFSTEYGEGPHTHWRHVVANA